MAAYPILQLKKGKEKSILNQHPWIFSGAIHKLPKAEHGDIVTVQDATNNTLGYGFYNADSQISCRIFEFSRFHKDDSFLADEAYFHQKIEKAFQLRKDFLLTSGTNAYRLLHGEGDFFSGIVVDIYDKVASVQLLTKGTEKIAPWIFNGLKKVGVKHIYLHVKESSKHLENVGLEAGWQTPNPPPMPVVVLENNLQFEVDIVDGQKTGFFLDQRDNRALVGTYSKNASVLNCFSYTGGFSVYALANKASKVVSVDISQAAIEVANSNVRLNFGANAPHEGVAQDCFEYLKQSKEGEFDIVILDPPAFAKHKRALQNATRGYISLNELGFKKVKSGGLVFTFSCSRNIDKDLFRKIVFQAAAVVGRNVRVIHQLTQPIDHPINIYHPEGEYLKGLVLQVE